MSGTPRTQISLAAYLKLLEGRGADGENLARRQALLEKLLPFLDERSANESCFRSAVDAALPQIDKHDWPFFLSIARDYYHFWIDDFKAIAALCRSGAFAAAPLLPQAPAHSLQAIWAQLATEKFVLSEKWPLNAYRAALQGESVAKDVVEIRVKLAQLLLLQLRQTTGQNGQTYRLALESMLPVFAKNETSRLFIAVGREFFHFWMGDPNAASHLNTNDTDAPERLWQE